MQIQLCVCECVRVILDEYEFEQEITHRPFITLDITTVIFYCVSCQKLSTLNSKQPKSVISFRRKPPTSSAKPCI